MGSVFIGWSESRPLAGCVHIRIRDVTKKTLELPNQENVSAAPQRGNQKLDFCMKPIQILTNATISLLLLASSGVPATAEGSASRDVSMTAKRDVVYVTQLFRRRRRQANASVKPTQKADTSKAAKSKVSVPTPKVAPTTPQPNVAQPTWGNRYRPASQTQGVTSPSQSPAARALGSVVVGASRGRNDFDYRTRFVVRNSIASEAQTAQKKTPTEKFSVGVLKSTLSKTSRPSASVPHPVKLSTGLHSVLVKLNGRSR